VQDGEVTQIEGDPDSPISRGRLCPKGSATRGLLASPLREYSVKYRAPGSRTWQPLALSKAMDMIADRVIATRNETWEAAETTDQGTAKLNRTLGLGSLGGATLDNEENYLIKKLFTALGVVSVENQARI
jgi:formate dehydrogenase major subunit